MPATDDAIQAAAKKVEDLRESERQERRDAAAEAQSKSRDKKLARLNAEADRLAGTPAAPAATTPPPPPRPTATPPADGDNKE